MHTKTIKTGFPGDMPNLLLLIAKLALLQNGVNHGAVESMCETQGLWGVGKKEVHKNQS